MINEKARNHAVALEQCALFLDSPHLKGAMTDAARFLRSIAESAKPKEAEGLRDTSAAERAAGRLVGIREAAEWLSDAARARYSMAAVQTAPGGPRHSDHAAVLEQAATAILALAEGKEG